MGRAPNVTKKQLIDGFYRNFDSTQAARINRAIYEAKAHGQHMSLPKKRKQVARMYRLGLQPDFLD